MAHPTPQRHLLGDGRAWRLFLVPWVPTAAEAAPRVIRSRAGIRALLPAVRLSRDGWWRLGGSTKRRCVSPGQNVLRSVTG